MRNSDNTHEDQRGLVSIVVTLIIMLVLTLIVTGFAQLARREQREALDRQLATQALYAAESGVNDATNRVKAEIAGGNLLTGNITECGKYSDIDKLGQNGAAPTCILVNKTPSKLIVPNIQTNKSKILPIAQGSGTLDSITISWQNKDEGSANVACGNSLADAGCAWVPATSRSNDTVGVLRIDLVPINGVADPLNPDTMRNRMFTAFLIPTDDSSGGVINYSSGAGVANQGVRAAARCNITPQPDKKCAIQITGLAGATQYYMRMKSIYNVADVVVCPSSGFGCDPNENMVGAQAVIDVTAKATDVLKRIQVRVAVDPDSSGTLTIPEYTIDSAETICKQMEVTPTNTQNLCAGP